MRAHALKPKKLDEEQPPCRGASGALRGVMVPKRRAPRHVAVRAVDVPAGRRALVGRLARLRVGPSLVMKRRKYLKFKAGSQRPCSSKRLELYERVWIPRSSFMTS